MIGGSSRVVPRRTLWMTWTRLGMESGCALVSTKTAGTDIVRTETVGTDTVSVLSRTDAGLREAVNLRESSLVITELLNYRITESM